MFDYVREHVEQVMEEIAQSIRNVNLGGCGVVALHLHDALAELGIDSQIVEVVYQEDLIYYTDDWRDMCTDDHCYHAVVVVDDGHGGYLVIDSDGVRDSFDEFTEESGCYPARTYPVKMFREYVADVYSWNSVFYHERDRPVIKQLISKLHQLNKI